MIADEYCDPLDLAETSSLLVDDDYSIPYDEVNKVLKGLFPRQRVVIFCDYARPLLDFICRYPNQQG